MTGNLQFDFLVDKEKNTIHINREFAASRQIVWDCNTKAELLDQWFAPEPLTAKTKSMDFREGGYWHYAMIEPDGKEHWSLVKYQSIQPMESISSNDYFSDNEANLNKNLPTTHWQTAFLDLNNHTLVKIIATFETLADLETVIQMGMEEGMTSALERLDNVLEKLNSK